MNNGLFELINDYKFIQIGLILLNLSQYKKSEFHNTYYQFKMSANQQFNSGNLANIPSGLIDKTRNVGQVQGKSAGQRSTSQKPLVAGNVVNQSGLTRNGILAGRMPTQYSAAGAPNPEFFATPQVGYAMSTQQIQQMNYNQVKNNMMQNQQISKQTNTKANPFQQNANRGQFSSPNKVKTQKLIGHQAQSHAQLPQASAGYAQKGNNLFLGVSGPLASDFEHHQSHQILLNNSKGGNQSILNLNNQKQITQKSQKKENTNGIYGQQNQRHNVKNFQSQQKYVSSNKQAQKSAGRAAQQFSVTQVNNQKQILKNIGGPGGAQTQMGNLSNTQNVNNKPMKLGHQNHLIGARGSSQHSATRLDGQEPRSGTDQLNVYNDVDNEGCMRIKNQNGSGSGSGGGSRSQNSRPAKDQAQGTGISQTLQGEELQGTPGQTAQNENSNSKTLYTNVSLRELSQSPDTRAVGNQAGRQTSKIQIAGAGEGNQPHIKTRIYQNTQFISNKRILQAPSQERPPNHQSHSQLQQVDQRLFNNTSLTNYQNNPQFYNSNGKRDSGGMSGSQSTATQQMELDNQLQLKNYLSQIQQNGTQALASNKKENGSILNIKTVQDINIYNNSFIINSNNLPQNLQNQQTQSNQSITTQEVQMSQGKVQIQNQAASQVTTVSGGKKGGLKLRKELSGLSTGLNQARSASQGRSNTRGISSSSNQQAINQIINVGPSRNNAALTEYNSYGAIQSTNPNLQKISRAYDVYNQNIRAQNIQSLQQNPNQKRILNPSSKVFGNLTAIGGIQSSGSLSQKQKQTYSIGKNNAAGNYYQNNTKALKQGGISKVLKGMLSSNTSRVQSRTDSRAGTRLNNGTLDKLPANGSLTSDSRNQANDINLNNQNQSTIQQMKKNYLSNQQMMIASGAGSQSNIHNGRNQAQFKSQSRASNHSQLLMNKAPGAAQSQMINIQDINEGGRVDLNHSQIAPSDLNGGLSNLHSQSQLYQSQKYNVNHNNSYEVRKQSLQELRNKNAVGHNSQQKFRNQLQQLSSDNTEPIRTPLGIDGQGQFVNSVSIKNDQYFHNQGGQKEVQPGNSKVVREYIEKQKALGQALQKIKKTCREVSAAEKETEMQNILQQLDQFQVKVSKVKKSIQSQGEDAGLEKIMERLIEYNQEATILRALCLIDQGQNYESIQEFDKICGIQSLMNDFNATNLQHSAGDSQASDHLLKMNIQATNKDSTQSKTKMCQLLMSIAQKRTGEHVKSLETITNCINQFPDFKDAYLVRGQQHLLNKQNQKALQDFMKFDQLINSEIQEQQRTAKNPQLLNQLSFQMCSGKELIGDAYKKMKKYKQASKSYQEALNEIIKLQKIKIADLSDKLQHFSGKVQIKIAMCSYYLGQITKAISLFNDQLKYLSKFNPSHFKVQQKQIKCNFYLAKSVLAQKQKDRSGSESYQSALKYLSLCNSDEIDPELHELYCGNSLFEIFKIFLKQKDIYSAHEYIQRATDNNFNSKRMSLYRDFTEGVMYLMKRKIKKGVQILTDLLEILINGQKEIEKINLSNKKDKKSGKSDKRDRYNVDESDSQVLQNKTGNTSIEQSTINGKVNEIGSGKFDQEQYDFLIFNIYVYRSYGYVAIEKYEHALEDLRKAKRISPAGIDKATIYNKWLSRGILKMDTEEYLMASKYFGKASLRFQNNKDAFCLNVISIVRSYSFSLSKLYIDNDQKLDKIMQTKRFLDVAIQCCCQEQKQPSLYFFRGLLHYQLHNFYDALNDFNIAIQEEEEATGQFHLARGRCYACLSILDEAMKDLSIALELDETLQEAYIFRGKCAYLLGDNNLAFHDFQKLIISDQKNPIVHIYAGNLLMTTGAYTDAVKAFDNADTVQQTSLAAFQRIRCYCALSDLENAFEQMQLCQHQAPNEKFAQFDYKVLLPLLSCVRSFAFSRNENGEPDETGKAEQIEILENCVSQISSIIEIYEKNEHLELKKEKSPMTIQIIPNVNKIKIEKKLVQKYLIDNKDGPFESVELSPQERKELNNVATHGYYRENIFQLEEMYLYRSIFHLYIGNIKESLVDLTKSWKQHFQSTAQAKKEAVTNNASSNNGMGIDTNLSEEMYGKFPISQLVSPMGSVHSFHTQKTDLSEVGLCSLNVNEFTYNQLILLIQQNNWQMSLKKVNELLSTNPATAEQSKSLKQLFIVRAMINQELGLTEKYNQDLTIYLKNFGQIKKNKQNAVVIEPFDVKGRLCSQFDPLPMNFTKPKTKSSFAIWMRPSFSMPFIKPPNMIPNINEEEVQSEFNLKQIDAPMPEAPWVRQCKNQNFQPQNYLLEFLQNEQANPKTKEAKSYPDWPADADSQQFLQNYFQSEQALIYDEKIQEDIDDLSDTDKVSLISDIELSPSDDSANQSPVHKQKGDVDLNLKKINKINQEKRAVGRVNNGIAISNQKYLCGHRRSCSSCHRLPIQLNMVNVSNLEQLIEILTLNKEEKVQRMKDLDFYKRGENQGGEKGKDNQEEFEDTVSEFELESSDEEEEEKSDAKHISSATTKEKRASQSSKYSHSRFSSNAGDLSDLENDIVGMHADLDAEDIDAQDLKIDEPNGKEKRLINDNRNILKKVGGSKGNKINQDFNQKITSIQLANEFGPNEDEQQTPQQIKANKKGGDRESLVNLGSKNMDKLNQKKKKKSSGIGGTSNLKKNKLAIAFNNLEMEQHNPNASDD